MAIGYLLVAITAVALFSMALAKINDEHYKNKIGGLTLFWFWLALADVSIYVCENYILNEWLSYSLFFVWIILSLAAGMVSNKNKE